MSSFFGKIKEAFKPHKAGKFKVYESNELKIIAMKTRIILENNLNQLLVTIQQQDLKFRYIGQDPQEVYTILQSIGEKVIEAESIKIFIEMMRKVEANSAPIVATNGDISLMRTEMRWFQCVLWYRRAREVSNLEDLYEFCMNFFKGIDITTELLVKCEVFEIYPILKYLQKGNALPLPEVLFYVQPYVSFNISQPTLDAVFVINKEQIRQKLEENNPKRMTFNPPSQSKTDFNRNYPNSAIFEVEAPKPEPVNPYSQPYSKVPANSGNIQPNNGMLKPNEFGNPYSSSSKINPYQQPPPPYQQNYMQPNRNTANQPIRNTNQSNYNPQDSNARFNNSSSFVPTQNLPNNIDNFGNNPWENPQQNQWNQNIPNQSSQWNQNTPNQSNQWNQNLPNQIPWQQPNINNSSMNTNPWQNSQANTNPWQPKPNNSELFNVVDQTDHNPFSNGNSAFRPKEPKKEEPKAPQPPKKSFMNSLLRSASNKARDEEACFILPEPGLNIPHNYEREPHQFDPNPNYGSTIPLSREELDRFNTQQEEKKRKEWEEQERRQREEEMKQLALKQERQRLARQAEEKRIKQLEQARKREQEQKRKEEERKRLEEELKRKQEERKRKEQQEKRAKQEQLRREREEEERKEREEEEREREQEERRRARERELMEERDVQIDVFADNEREEIDRGASGRFSMNMGFRTQFGDQNIEQFTENSPNLMNNSILRFSKDPKTAYKEEIPINQGEIDEADSLQIINTADLSKPAPAYKLCYFKKTEA